MSRLGAAKKREQRTLAAAPPPPPQRGAPVAFGQQAPKPTSTRRSNAISYTELSWGDVQSITRNAEFGYTEQLADLWNRMKRSDDQILSTCETRSNAIAGARREMVPAKTRPELEPLAKRAAEDCEALLDSLPDFVRTLFELLDADYLGWSSQEIIWEPRGDLVWVDRLNWIPSRWFRFTQQYVPYIWADGQGLERAKDLGITPPEGVMGLPLTPRKYIFHTPKCITDVVPVSGIGLAMQRPWWVKSWATKFWLAGSDQSGNPRLLGMIPENATPEVQAAMYEALSTLGADGVAVLRQGSSLTVLDPMQSGEGGVWDALLKRCDAAIAKAALGSTLNVEVGDTGGNRALGESQADTTIAPRWVKSAASLANTIERQLLRPFLEMNAHRYGGHVFVPTLTLHIVEDEPTIDDLIVRTGKVRVDELRRSRKLAPLGAEHGGDEFVVLDVAPPSPFGAAQEAGTPRPLPQQSRPLSLSASRPWTRAASIAGRAVTATSTPSPTTPSASER